MGIVSVFAHTEMRNKLSGPAAAIAWLIGMFTGLQFGVWQESWAAGAWMTIIIALWLCNEYEKE